IRDYKVTGVQTCALPIYTYSLGNTTTPLRWKQGSFVDGDFSGSVTMGGAGITSNGGSVGGTDQILGGTVKIITGSSQCSGGSVKIGRASCRERVEGEACE